MHSALGESDQAFTCLGRVVEVRHLQAPIEMGTHPGFDPLRGDSRYSDLLRRVEIADLAPEEVKARQVERQWEDSDGMGTWEEGAESSSAASRGRSGYDSHRHGGQKGGYGGDLLTEQGEDQSAPSDLEYSGERDMARFWREIRPRHEPLDKRWFLPIVLVLMVISVPWYLPPGFVGRLYGGLPVWIWIALVCSVVLAAITSFVALRSWRDDDDG